MTHIDSIEPPDIEWRAVLRVPIWTHSMPPVDGMISPLLLPDPSVAPCAAAHGRLWRRPL
jgi:hypothetical protein